MGAPPVPGTRPGGRAPHTTILSRIQDMNPIAADRELGTVSWAQNGALGTLIMGCRETGRMYRRGARTVSNTDHRALLMALSRRRSSFVADLSTFSAGRKGAPWVGATYGAIRRGARWVVGLQGAHDGDTFRDCAKEEFRVLRLYASALQREWPSEMRAVLEEQFREMETNYDEMRKLRALH